MKKHILATIAVFAALSCLAPAAETLDTALRKLEPNTNKPIPKAQIATSNFSYGLLDKNNNILLSAWEGTLKYQGTFNAFHTSIVITDPTANRTITFPDASGTVVYNPVAGTYVFEGDTADAFETTLAVVDPTVADGTVWFPDLMATGFDADNNVSVVISTINSGLNGLGRAGAVWTGPSTIVAEGATANTSEVTVNFADPTGDNLLTVSDTAGVADTFAMVTLAQTFANKTFTSPIINGATSSGSTAINLSGNTGAFTTPTADATIPSDSTGGNLGASNSLTGIVNSTLVTFGTMTNGTATAKTVALMDDTPAAEFSAVTVGTAPTDTQDATIARKGTNSLKLAWPDAAVAGDGVQWTAFSAEDWTTEESVGFWIYTDVALSAGDLTFVIVDSTADHAFNIPAVATINKWTWVEVDISALATTDGDAVTNYKILASTAGAAKGVMNTYFDGGWKWDATEELALGVDLVDSPGAVRKLMALVKANTGTHDYVALVEDTDFFVHSESGNDFLVTITDQSANAAIGLVNHK